MMIYRWTRLEMIDLLVHHTPCSDKWNTKLFLSAHKNNGNKESVLIASQLWKSFWIHKRWQLGQCNTHPLPYFTTTKQSPGLCWVLQYKASSSKISALSHFNIKLTIMKQMSLHNWHLEISATGSPTRWVHLLRRTALSKNPVWFKMSLHFSGSCYKVNTPKLCIFSSPQMLFFSLKKV